MTIGERIRNYRTSLGLSGKDFAAKVGISPGSLSDIETGKTKPSADTIASIVRNTEIDAAWLLTGDKSVSVAESEEPYGPHDPVISKINQHLNEMCEDQRRDVLKYAEEKKLLSELMLERHGRKAG